MTLFFIFSLLFHPFDQYIPKFSMFLLSKIRTPVSKHDDDHIISIVFSATCLKNKHIRSFTNSNFEFFSLESNWLWKCNTKLES